MTGSHYVGTAETIARIAEHLAAARDALAAFRQSRSRDDAETLAHLLAGLHRDALALVQEVAP